MGKSYNTVEETMHIKYVDEQIKNGLGYDQLNLYLPIKLK